MDIGIARGEIDYVASNRIADPRGAAFRRELTMSVIEGKAELPVEHPDF
jgi:hypothetical protein